jgi:hypothetical protein
VFVCTKIWLLSTEFCDILCVTSQFMAERNIVCHLHYKLPDFISWQEHFQGGRFTMLINIIRPLQ